MAGSITKLNIIDITTPISSKMPVYPGDPVIRVERVSDVARGDAFTLSALCMGSHTGTHVDAPSHLLPDVATVDRLPLNAMIGDAMLVGLPGVREVTHEVLAAVVPDGCERLLLKTGDAEAHMSDEAARWLAECGVRLVGIDTLSVDAPRSETLDVHRTLLGVGVIILENLALDSVSPGRYTLVCLPLKIAGCDGAPARVVLIEGGIDR
jgi:arylformamidase